jgi:hypothetical protein
MYVVGPEIFMENTLTKADVSKWLLVSFAAADLFGDGSFRKCIAEAILHGRPR